MLKLLTIILLFSVLPFKVQAYVAGEILPFEGKIKKQDSLIKGPVKTVRSQGYRVSSKSGHQVATLIPEYHKFYRNDGLLIKEKREGASQRERTYSFKNDRLESILEKSKNQNDKFNISKTSYFYNTSNQINRINYTSGEQDNEYHDYNCSDIVYNINTVSIFGCTDKEKSEPITYYLNNKQVIKILDTNKIPYSNSIETKETILNYKNKLHHTSSYTSTNGQTGEVRKKYDKHNNLAEIIISRKSNNPIFSNKLKTTKTVYTHISLDQYNNPTETKVEYYTITNTEAEILNKTEHMFFKYTYYQR